MKKKKFKGFTLVELVVVMAIFAILMAAVMALIDPVSKMMKKSTIQEANSAAVDNVKRYIEGNLKYANAIEAHIGALTDTTNPVDPLDVSTDVAKQNAIMKVASNFAQQYYINKSDENNKPYQGKIRIMEIDNVNGGRINEYVVDFEAGYTIVKAGTDLSVTSEYQQFKVKENVAPKLIDIDSDGEIIEINSDVINPAYYEHYRFFFEPGYKELETTEIAAVADDEYTATFKNIEREKEDGTTYTIDSFNPKMFSMSVVTYKEDAAYPATADDTATTTIDETKLFESPFAISNVTMSLVNVDSEFTKHSNLRQYYGPVRYSGYGDYKGAFTTMDPINNEVDVTGDDGEWDYERAADLLSGSGYSQSQGLWEIFDMHKSESPNLYFVYTLPEAK